MFPVHKALAIMSLYPDSLFHATINGQPYLMRGGIMRGFLLPNDTLSTFRKF